MTTTTRAKVAGKGRTFIPSEVIYDILLRLPVKSLVRFKSLSKNYLSVISHSEFIAQHLRFSLSNNNKYPSLLLNRVCSLPISLLRPDFTVTPELFFPLAHAGQDIRLSLRGSCNGLLLAEVTIQSQTQLLLWNPATRHFRHLPTLPHLYSCHASTHGFGFNSHIDDYYVMQISYFDDCVDKYYNNVIVLSHHDDDTEFIVRAKVFSCRKNIWTTIPSTLPCAYYTRPVALKVGGCEHMFWEGLGRGSLNQTQLILAFDMINLDFKKIVHPFGDEFFEPIVTAITQFKESLAVFIYSQFEDMNTRHVALWVLNNDISADVGRDSWTKMYDIGPFERLVVPITIWGEHEFIFVSDDDGSLCACDITDDPEVENKVVRRISRSLFASGNHTYVESLVPINGDNAASENTVLV